jgi:hypothetical protein
MSGGPHSANGDAKTNGDKKTVNGANAEPKLALAVPDTVITEALKVTRECLEAVVSVEER